MRADGVDRRFFHEAWDQERILLALIEDIRGAGTMPEISRLVSRELEAALHPASIHVCYRAGDANELTLGYSSDGAQQLRIPESYQLLRLMAGEQARSILARSGAADCRMMNSTGSMRSACNGWFRSAAQAGCSADERSDIFSLGVIVAEALTGQRPFAGRTQAELLLAIRQQAWPLNDDNAAMNRLNAVLQQSLAADPERRFSGVDEFRQALIPVLKAVTPRGQ